MKLLFLPNFFKNLFQLRGLYSPRGVEMFGDVFVHLAEG